MTSLFQSVRAGIERWWKRYLSTPLVTPDHVAVMAMYGVGGIGTGFIYLTDIQHPTALLEALGVALTNIWMTLSLLGGLLALWGVLLATKRRYDPRDGFKIELAGTIMITLTQGVYLSALINSLGIGSVAQTQLYAFMFTMAGLVRSLQLPLQIIKARYLFRVANHLQEGGVAREEE